MNSQTGVLTFDSRVIDKREIAFLSQSEGGCRGDYSTVHLGGSIAMGFRGVLITPQDKQDQPLVSKALVLTFDGRLDRREELTSRMGLVNTTVLSDADLVALAYEATGEKIFEDLIGEFACVLWDIRLSLLFMVRSLCGTRPLFYVVSDKQAVWSSDIRDLILKTDVDLDVNDAYVLGFAYYQPDPCESPYRKIHVVPPGSYVCINHRGDERAPVSTWHPERIQALRLASDDEYEALWREQVEIAVADKLRARGPIFAELSGGLDSSTLVLMADRVLTKSGRDPAGLTTASRTFETSVYCDESFFISMVEKARNRVGIHVPESALKMTLGLEPAEFVGLPSRHQQIPGKYEMIASAMQSEGACVLLNGIGGDEIFWSDSSDNPELADLLLKGRFLELLLEARKWSEYSGVPLWREILNHAVVPITTALSYFPWRPLETVRRIPWCTPAVRKWFAQSGRRLGLRLDPNVQLPSRRTRVLSVRSFQAVVAGGQYPGHEGIYFSHPYSHQRLIDFMLSVPMEQVIRPGEGRSLMRRALHGLLPEKVRIRRSKGGTDEAFCRTVAGEYHTIGELSSLEVCRRGYAEPKALTEPIRLTRIGRLQYCGALSRLFCVEQWLRSLTMVDSRRSTVRQNGQRTPELHSADLSGGFRPAFGLQ